MSPDIAASIRARLLNQAKARGEEFELTLTRFAGERFLFRLGASAARDRCLLKGASLLSVWLPNPYRATRDVDLLAFGSADDQAIRALVTQICAVPCDEDGLRFDLSAMAIATIRPEDEQGGRRARFRAWLGSTRITVQIDIGAGDAVDVEPEDITYPTLLPSLPAPRLRAYPRELTVAEKFEAMVTLGTRNSRMKDFHDLWALSEAFAFDGPSLRRAIAACLEHRGAAPAGDPPGALTPEFYRLPEIVGRWGSYLAGGGVLTAPPSSFEAIGGRIGVFIGPVWDSIAAGEPLDSTWPPSGPWEAGEAERRARP